MIRLCDVHFSYTPGVKVIDGLSLEFPDTGVFALYGPSGSGKTTLLHLIAGLLQPVQGTITGLEGRRVSMVFQEDRLLPWRTAFENVATVCGENEAIARRWLADMELEEAANQYPAALSGGMRRRVAIARAAAYGGDVLLMDEPFKGLDEALRARVSEQLRQAAPLIVMVAHAPEDAKAMHATVLHL